MTNTKLQAANRYFLSRFSPFITHLVTLNLLERKQRTYIKLTGWDKGAIKHSDIELTNNAAVASVRYFIARLNYALHGKRSRNKRYGDVCRIVAIPVLEGTTNGKRKHFHILLGNVPANKLDDLEKYVADAWAKTTWGMTGVDVKALDEDRTDAALYYTGKEVGYYNDDAVLWQQASIPRRLLGARA